MTASPDGAPSLAWADLAGRRVGVWGVGVEGRATLRRLRADGVVPAVVAESTAPADVEALLGCDLVVKSPGISPYDEPARRLAESGVELVGGLGLWLGGVDARRVVGVTGTKGKSTTASIIGALATGLGADCLVGGNLGTPPWDPTVPPADWYVVEVSSYQAHDLRVGPAVVVVTSLSQDHLVWHGGYERYVADKLSLATRPGVRTVLAPLGDVELAARADLLGPHLTWVPRAAGADETWLAGLGLIGAHNARNALLARAALVALGVPGADDDAAVAAATAAYRPLASRLTSLGSVDGVEFVDDSLATNVLPTLAAVAAFPGRRVALLVGGQDRGIDYAPLGHGLAERAAGDDAGDDAVLVLTLPDSGPRIAAEVRAAAPQVEVRECADLDAATRAGFAWARDGGPGGVVLLSPAAPSFGVFRDYAERAAAFEAVMGTL